MCVPLSWVVVGGGAHLHRLHCFPLFRVDMGEAHLHRLQLCVPLPWVEVGEGLICIIRDTLWMMQRCPYPTYTPGRERQSLTLGGGGGGAHVHYPQCVSLYFEWSVSSSTCLGWRWKSGSFASFIVCLPLL